MIVDFREIVCDRSHSKAWQRCAMIFILCLPLFRSRLTRLYGYVHEHFGLSSCALPLLSSFFFFYFIFFPRFFRIPNPLQFSSLYMYFSFLFPSNRLRGRNKSRATKQVLLLVLLPSWLRQDYIVSSYTFWVNSPREIN
jgi:hypothetical protein